MKKDCDYQHHPTKPGKIWHFLIHEDSWRSFLVNAILIILIGKFLLYPGIGAVMGNDFPIVAVVSGSMDHQGKDLDAWWTTNGAWYEQNGIAKSDFEQFYLKDGFKKGDVILVKDKGMDEIAIGDTIVYNSGYRQYPIIHRVVSTKGVENQMVLETKGDANNAQLTFEKSITEEQIYGEAVFYIPKIGWIKVALVDLIN